MDLGKIVTLVISLVNGTGPLTEIVKLVLQIVALVGQLGGAKPAAMDVAWVQRALVKLGFDPGPVDGILGPKTQAAVVKFQQSRGLEPDGWVGGETQTKLRLEAGDA